MRGSYLFWDPDPDPQKKESELPDRNFCVYRSTSRPRGGRHLSCRPGRRWYEDYGYSDLRRERHSHQVLISSETPFKLTFHSFLSTEANFSVVRI